MKGIRARFWRIPAFCDWNMEKLLCFQFSGEGKSTVLSLISGLSQCYARGKLPGKYALAARISPAENRQTCRQVKVVLPKCRRRLSNSW